jgi:hypothetical protein
MPLASFLIYLLEALSGASPFNFLSFYKLYLALLVIYGKLASNS